jgi:16S rRNA (guanine527-N7)-methyltransferase
VAALGCRYGLPAAATEALGELLDALAAEPDPPTTIRAPEHAVDAHLADSLSGLEIAALAEADTVVDLGSGAGFPGLALAAARPAARFDLLEAVRRKCETIERLRTAAGIENARAVARRAEDWAREEGAEAYAAATARAVAPLAVLCEYAAPLLRPGGALVCWKGARDPSEEAAGARAAAEVGLRPLEVRAVVPFEDARHRHLHVFEKVAPTPARLPRRAGVAAKRPLGA